MRSLEKKHDAMFGIHVLFLIQNQNHLSGKGVSHAGAHG